VPVIPATWETKRGGLWLEEDYGLQEVGEIHFQKQVSMVVIPATWEVKVGDSPPRQKVQDSI
jgi:hypothetical protein